MPYRIQNLTRKGNTWTGTLEYWEECYCSKTSTEFSIEQETQPTLKEIIYEVGSS